MKHKWKLKWDFLCIVLPSKALNCPGTVLWNNRNGKKVVFNISATISLYHSMEVAMYESTRYRKLPAVSIGIHLHMSRINCGVNHDPGASPQFGLGWNVNKDRLPVFPQAIHNVGSKLQHLVIHIYGKKETTVRISETL